MVGAALKAAGLPATDENLEKATGLPSEVLHLLESHCPVAWWVGDYVLTCLNYVLWHVESCQALREAKGCAPSSEALEMGR